jgi:hypothetical protein
MRPDAPEPTLSVVVPATDVPASLPACLAAVEASRAPGDEVLAITRPAGASPAYARNAGARRAGGDVLVFVDADVLLHDDACARIRAAFAARPELAALIGSYDDAPAASGPVSGFRNLLHHHVHQEAAGPIASFWSGLGAIRRDVFLALGGFDTAHYGAPTIEDIDLGLRLAAAGLTTELDPTVQGTHLKRWTLRSMVLTDLVYRGMPWIALLLQAPASPRVLNLGVRHQLSAALSVGAAVALLRGRPGVSGAALAGVAALNRDLYALIRRRRGLREALAAVPLHVVHHLTSVAALPLGVASFLRKPGTFLAPDRPRPAGLRGLHVGEDTTPRTPRLRSLSSRPVVARRDEPG